MTAIQDILRAGAAEAATTDTGWDLRSGHGGVCDEQDLIDRYIVLVVFEPATRTRGRWLSLNSRRVRAQSRDEPNWPTFN